ncbi:hypothetical protein HDU92_002294 [Lobulomyces angularis]|nr:hypothetical protein HDU92_002294 [Lobulomyces angularis]
MANIQTTASSSYRRYQEPVSPLKIQAALIVAEKKKVQHQIDMSSQEIPIKSTKKSPTFLLLLTVLQILLFILSLVFNYLETGYFLQVAPFNIMIGPSTSVLVRMGSRYSPCMKPVYNETEVKCLQGMKSEGAKCTIQEVCGFNSAFISNGNPNQWFRFIVPIFLHGGVVHLLLNLSIQINTGFSLERSFGSIRMFIVYFISGIGGFLFSANFNGTTPSVGASGSLYGLIAVLLVDLMYTWKETKGPFKQLLKITLFIVFAFLIGNIDSSVILTNLLRNTTVH